MTDIILFWVQGSWKWTQASLLMDAMPETFSYFSSGDMFRALTSKSNAIWDYLKGRMEAGELISDQVTMTLFRAYMYTAVDENKAMLLDGFPRTLPQFELLLSLFQEFGRSFVGVVFDVSEDEVIERMLARWRADDNRDAIKYRIDQYNEKTLPMLDMFNTHASLITIDANRSIEDIHADLLTNVADIH